MPKHDPVPLGGNAPWPEHRRAKPLSEEDVRRIVREEIAVSAKGASKKAFDLAIGERIRLGR